MTLSIAGKTAIVTGAAHGIGLAIARHFHDKGANVMFVDVDEAQLEAQVGAEARSEGRSRFFSGDLRQKLTLTNLLSATCDAFDRVDVLVNACRQMQVSTGLCAEEDAVEKLLQQNFFTALRMSQMTAKRMIQWAEKQGDADGPIGSIINLSSIAATRTRPGLLGYSISCAAVDQMTRSLAVEYAPKGIRVNAVAFGSLMSASLQSAIKDNPDYLSAIEAGTPQRRIAPASELVETVQFLASDAASFITGQILTVDGGRSLLDAVDVPAH